MLVEQGFVGSSTAWEEICKHNLVLSLKFLTSTDFSFDIILHLQNADGLEILNTKMSEQFAFRRRKILSKLGVIFWFNHPYGSDSMNSLFRDRLKIEECSFINNFKPM